MPLSTEEYLQKKGAIELICEIDSAGSRFGEILEEIPIARPTLSDRLAEGREAFLLDREILSAEKDTVHVHILTSEGAQLRLFFDDNGVTKDYRDYKTALKRFQDRQSGIRDQFESDPPKLDGEAYGRGALGVLSDRNS